MQLDVITNTKDSTNEFLHPFLRITIIEKMFPSTNIDRSPRSGIYQTEDEISMCQCIRTQLYVGYILASVPLCNINRAGHIPSFPSKSQSCVVSEGELFSLMMNSLLR